MGREVFWIRETQLFILSSISFSREELSILSYVTEQLSHSTRHLSQPIPALLPLKHT